MPVSRPAPVRRTAKPPPAPAPVRTHMGVLVVDEVPIEHLPGKPFRISRLTLQDGRQVFGCRDCDETGETRGEIMAHRNRKHGARIGLKRANGAQPKVDVLDSDGDVLHTLLPNTAPRPEPPDAVMEMTLGEILALAPTIHAMGQHWERLEVERDTAVAELTEMRGSERSNMLKIAAYDDMRAELTELRSWKKKIIARLKPLGFKLEEE